MLAALLSGKALTATELAREAGVTPQTASSHLARLSDGGLLNQRKQGRHKYFGLANDDVAQVLEGLMGLAAGIGHLRTRTGPKDVELRRARVCYNHLAGDMGTQLFDSLLANGHMALRREGLTLTASGEDFAEGFGIDIVSLRSKRAPLCRECLDWSERRSHLAGSLGRALFAQMEELGWAKRQRDSRAVMFSADGERKFHATFKDAGTRN